MTSCSTKTPSHIDHTGVYPCVHDDMLFTCAYQRVTHTHTHTLPAICFFSFYAWKWNVEKCLNSEKNKCNMRIVRPGCFSSVFNWNLFTATKKATHYCSRFCFHIFFSRIALNLAFTFGLILNQIKKTDRMSDNKMEKKNYTNITKWKYRHTISNVSTTSRSLSYIYFFLVRRM